MFKLSPVKSGYGKKITVLANVDYFFTLIVKVMTIGLDYQYNVAMLITSTEMSTLMN